MTIQNQDPTQVVKGCPCPESEPCADLFARAGVSYLTSEQQAAAATIADRHLLIAAAGSGKTSTMVGKVAHAILDRHCRPEQILVLAFNRKAAHELKERLGTRFPVDVRTLHALGLAIVSRVKGRPPKVEDDEDALLHRVLKQLVHHDAAFAEQWLLFRVFHHLPVRDPHQFRSHREWLSFVRTHGESQHGSYGFLTLRGELLPTQFEQAVANWLYLYGIDYLYTPLRSSCLQAMTGWLTGGRCAGRGIMRGGFRMPLMGRTGFWLEKQKRRIICLGACARPVRLVSSDIVVQHHEFQDASVFATLRRRLGLSLPVSLQPGMIRVLTALGYRMTSGQTDFLERFIRLARMNGIGPQALLDRAHEVSDHARAGLHAPMLARLLSAYQAALDAHDSIDFEGMLHRAADALDDDRYRHPYIHILVDEFQDTSRGGLRLLKSLLSQNSFCTLFAVGDDWQSIYRFAGAVPDVLSRFEHHFGPAVINHLTATFRFDQSVADLASRFVQANPAQLRKQVRARPVAERASVTLASYASAPHMYALCEMCLNDIVAGLSSDVSSSCGPSPSKTTVYLLGRYQHQRPRQLERWRCRFPQLDIQYLTVHSAKGLEADMVIVLGLHTGRYGFPSQVPDDPLMELVKPDLETFPDAEERRLFYVAITRCRQRVYLLSSAHRPSPFVAELLKDGAPHDVLSSVQREPYGML